MDRLVDAGEGISVGPESHAYALQVIRQGLLFEVLGFIETHMLEEMRLPAHRPLPSTRRL